MSSRPFTRREFLSSAVAAMPVVFVARAGVTAAAGSSPIRLGLPQTLIAPTLDEFGCLSRYFEEFSPIDIQFVQLKTNDELSSSLLSGDLDLAWVSGYALVRHRANLAPIAVPVWQGAPMTRSCLIVSAARRANSLIDLAGDAHALVDAESASGFLVTAAAVADRGIRLNDFFRQTFFTYGDRNVVRAVAAGLADSGTCDAHVLAILAEVEPHLAAKVRILESSPPIGAPPIVAALGALAPGDAKTIGSVFTEMRSVALGEATLAKLRLDGFVEPAPDLYDLLAEKAGRLKGLV